MRARLANDRHVMFGVVLVADVSVRTACCPVMFCDVLCACSSVSLCMVLYSGLRTREEDAGCTSLRMYVCRYVCMYVVCMSPEYWLLCMRCALRSVGRDRLQVDRSDDAIHAIHAVGGRSVTSKVCLRCRADCLVRCPESRRSNVIGSSSCTKSR